MNRINLLAILATMSIVGGCGGDVQVVDNPAPPPSNESVGGIWDSVPTSFTLVDENGLLFSRTVDSTTQCVTVTQGNLVTDLTSVSGNGSVVTSCPSTNDVYSGVVFSGAVSQRKTLDLTETSTSDGSVVTTNYTYDYKLYEHTSSISRIVGNWETSPSNVLSINSDGTIFSQDGNTGCVVNGVASLLSDDALNTYSVSMTYSNCQGADAVLNGYTAIGLLTRDYSASPNTLYIGTTVEINGVTDVSVDIGTLQ